MTKKKEPESPAPELLDEKQIEAAIDEVNTKKVVGRVAIERLVPVGRSLRIHGQANRLLLGQTCSLIRGLCGPYDKIPGSGLSRTKTYARMGISRSTADRLADEYDFCAHKDHPIPGDTFLLLAGQGLNLISLMKEKDAETEKQWWQTWGEKIKALDICNGDLVATLIEEIKTAEATAAVGSHEKSSAPKERSSGEQEALLLANFRNEAVAATIRFLRQVDGNRFVTEWREFQLEVLNDLSDKLESANVTSEELQRMPPEFEEMAPLEARSAS